MVLVIVLAIFASGCVATFPPARVIRESGDLIVRLEPAKKCDSGNKGKPLSHPAQLTNDQVQGLLASLSAREKVGLLSSFIGTPGTPRLFSQTDLDLLVPAVQEAFAKATGEEAIVFLLAKPAKDSRINVTSGMLAIHEDVLSVVVVNFRHPVRTTLSDVGATDRLSDVKETLEYVRAAPCVSVGEQDFAIFFDIPRFQLEPRSGSLLRYPERALSIAYRSFLTAAPDANNGIAEGENTLHSTATAKKDSQAIADLQRRIAELEQANQALAAGKGSTQPTDSTPDAPQSTSANSPRTNPDSQAAFLEIIKRLETRLSDLERQLKQPPPR